MLNLEEIKRFDDTMWLHVLKTKTVFDADQIKAHKDWLIDEVERLQSQVANAVDNYYLQVQRVQRVYDLRKADRELVELGEYILKKFRSDIDGTTTETARKIIDRMYKQNKHYQEALENIKRILGSTPETYQPYTPKSDCMELINQVLTEK